MEAIGFIGAIDKKDLLISMAGVLKYVGKNILIVDATSIQRFRYFVPMPNTSTNTFVSDYLGIDVAVGFTNLNSIAQFLGRALNYDYILIDSDNPQTFFSFGFQTFKKLFFVTGYDIYDINRGTEVFKYINVPLEINRIIYSNNLSDEEDRFLTNLINNPNIKWSDKKIEFSDHDVDRKTHLRNQLSKQISFKAHSREYKQWLEYLVKLITDSDDPQYSRIISRY